MNARRTPCFLLASLAFACLSACSSSAPTLGVIEPVPPPPARQTSPEAAQWLSGPSPRELGRRASVPPPRYGVAMFASADGEGAARPYSKEWAAHVANLLDFNKVGGRIIELAGSVDASDEKLETALAGHATSPAAREVDILILGALHIAPSTEARLMAFDTRDGRPAARASFVGDPPARPADVLKTAVGEVLKQMEFYWVDLDRGRLAMVPVQVEGLRHPQDLELLLAALASLQGVERARQIATAVEGGVAAADFQLFAAGEAAALEPEIAKLEWTGPGWKGKLEGVEKMRFRARYE